MDQETAFGDKSKEELQVWQVVLNCQLFRALNALPFPALLNPPPKSQPLLDHPCILNQESYPLSLTRISTKFHNASTKRAKTSVQSVKFDTCNMIGVVIIPRANGPRAEAGVTAQTEMIQWFEDFKLSLEKLDKQGQKVESRQHDLEENLGQKVESMHHDVDAIRMSEKLEYVDLTFDVLNPSKTSETQR